jgi:Raf kinase inhibitor-like YbhB/YbcL family protein
VKKIFFIGVILIAGILYILKPYLFQKTAAPVQNSMILTSSAFGNGGKIPVEFSCDGEKIHPPLSIAGVPSAAKSLVIIVDDPDAPSGIFTHWVIWNIDPSVKEIKEEVVPEKSQEGTNSAGSIGYTPPCPPPAGGQHRYFFTLFALDAKLGLDGKATKAEVEGAMAGHVMVQSLLVGVYSR